MFNKLVNATREVLEAAEKAYGFEIKWRKRYKRELRRWLKKRGGRIKSFVELMAITLWSFQVIASVCGGFGVGIYDDTGEGLRELAKLGAADIDERILADGDAMAKLEKFRRICVAVFKLQDYARMIELGEQT